MHPRTLLILGLIGVAAVCTQPGAVAALLFGVALPLLVAFFVALRVFQPSRLKSRRGGRR